MIVWNIDNLFHRYTLSIIPKTFMHFKHLISLCIFMLLYVIDRFLRFFLGKKVLDMLPMNYLFVTQLHFSGLCLEKKLKCIITKFIL